MKFSDITREDWQALQPYLDTCVLPFTGLNGDEQPWEATAALERLRDALELVEIPYKGRIVTYPALHYAAEAGMEERISALSAKLKASGFRYVVLVTACPKSAAWQPAGLDLLLYVEMERWEGAQDELKKEASERIQALWQAGKSF